MKKILCLLTAVLLSLSSCSNDNDEASNFQEPLFVKEIAGIYNGITYTQKISYNGNKIQSINFQGGLRTYTYTDNLITKIEDLDASGNLSSAMEYKYENGKIYSCLSMGYDFGTLYKNLIKYVHNPDGSVSYQYYKVNYTTGEEQEKDLVSGKLFIKDGNIIKDEIYSDSVLEVSMVYEYDDKNEIFKNILGYNLLLNLMPSANNIVKSTTIYKMGPAGIVVNSYEYNSNGYPSSKKVDVANGTPFSVIQYKY